MTIGIVARCQQSDRQRYGCGAFSDPLIWPDGETAWSSALRGFGERLGELVEMAQGRGRKLNLLAARVFGIGELQPSLVAHRSDAGVKRGRRAQFALRHHVPD